MEAVAREYLASVGNNQLLHHLNAVMETMPSSGQGTPDPAFLTTLVELETHLASLDLLLDLDEHYHCAPWMSGWSGVTLSELR